MTALALALATLAACANAAGDLFQRASARSESSDLRGSLSLLVRLVRQPRWLAGVVVSLLGLAVHVTALSVGELATVQPVLVAELPLAVVGASYLFGRGLGVRDLLSVAMLAVGLALFIGFLGPSGGDPLRVSGGTWAIAVGTVALLVALLAVAGWRAEHDVRGGLLRAAAGAGYGLTGVFFSVMGKSVDADGFGAAFTTWQTYGALAAGGLSFYLLQNAITAGKLVAVEPGLTLVNPLVAVTWGMLVFGEDVRTGGALVGTAVGGVLLVAGVVLLARSPVLENHEPDVTTPPAPRVGRPAAG